MALVELPRRAALAATIDERISRARGARGCARPMRTKRREIALPAAVVPVLRLQVGLIQSATTRAAYRMIICITDPEAAAIPSARIHSRSAQSS
jgi:hypothetical protein